jgi:hypothetical protein
MYDDLGKALTQAIADAFEAAYPGVPLAIDNKPFDWSNLPDLFAELEMQFHGGRQIGMSVNPRTRVMGHVYATVSARVGTGEVRLREMMGWFAAQLEYQTIGRMQLQAAEPDTHSPAGGFFSEGIKVYFYADPA